jgi:hypothetical protein
MPNKVTKVSPTRWYQIGMVWLVIALPLTAVIVSMITVTIAYKAAPTIISTPSDH